MHLKLAFAVAVTFMLAGMLIDCSYQRSTPDAAYVQGIVVGFDRRTRDSIHNGRGLTRFGSTIVG